MSVLRRRAGGLPHGALTPMLDTLFLLLFALLAMSDARDPHEEVRIELPDVERDVTSGASNADRVVLWIDADSILRAAPEGPPLRDRVALDRALDAALEGRSAGGVLVELRADRDARHGVVADLLQHLRLGGFVDVEMVAEALPEAADLGEPR